MTPRQIKEELRRYKVAKRADDINRASMNRSFEKWLDRIQEQCPHTDTKTHPKADPEDILATYAAGRIYCNICDKEIE